MSLQHPQPHPKEVSTQVEIPWANQHMLYQNIMSSLCSLTSSQLKERDTIKVIVHLNDKQENLKRHDPITHPWSDGSWEAYEISGGGDTYMYFSLNIFT